VPPGYRFCDTCGAAVGEGAPAVPADAPPVGSVAGGPGPAATTERRLVSVLFADLVGFTTLSEARDAEEVRELLSTYFDTSRTLVERYGGVVEKFIGDAVMAVWGTPVTNEDDAERAVRAAIDLVDAVAALGESAGVPDLRARAGVLTGEAAVNLGATGQGMVAGDLVNTASRIQSAADPGTVLVGEATRRATEASVAYAPAGPHEMKGKAEPVELWRASRVIAGVRGLMKSEGLEPPFVGRELELKLVKDLFHASADEARAQLVQVTGIAGIGKSRLGWEFFKYLDGLRKVYFWHRGRCLAYGEGVTYWALAEMVRGRAEIVEGEERPSALAKLHAVVDASVPDPDEQRFVEPRLAHLLGLEDRTAHDKSDLFAGWRLFFERLAEQLPVVLVFEDLQWADASMLEFLDYLLQWSRSLPIFVMTLARPSPAESAFAARRNATSLHLEPLPESAMRRLLTGLIPGLPDELTSKIMERAEGVPLYAVETVRMLLDRGLLVQEGDVYRPAGSIEALDVPETLQGLIAARLDGLLAEERRLVQDASVLGKTFTRQALAMVSGLEERDLDPLLSSLVGKEVLSVQADPRSPERGQYGFLQDLVRTVAYETLAKRDRKAKHIRAATYLEQAWGADEEEIVEVVASHYLEAYRLAPDADDAQQMRDAARRMLVRAGERAASLAAAEEARTYFLQAAELTDSGLERAELAERAGQMAWLRGRPEEASASFEDSVRLFEESGQTHSAARVQARLAELEFVRDHLEQAIDRVGRAYAVLSGEEPDRDLAVVAGQLGRFLAIAGRHEEAAPPIEVALELAEHMEFPDVYSHALNSKSLSLTRRGRMDEAETLLKRALEVALEHRFIDATSRAYNNLGVVLESTDRFNDTIALSQAQLDFVRQVGDRAVELGVLTGVLGSLVAVGEWDRALEWADEARSADELASLEWAVVGLLDLVPLHVRRGALDVARELLEDHRDYAASENVELRMLYGVNRAEWLRAEADPAGSLAAAEEVLSYRAGFGLVHQSVKRALVIAMEAALDLGDLAKVEELLTTVADAKPGEVFPHLRAHTARLSSRLADRRGDRDAVEPGFAAAERGFRDIGMPFDLAVALLEHAEWLSGEARADEAAPLLAEARQIFDRLGAKPWLARLDRLSQASAAQSSV
jgi:class 3 adenylate cyclase/tetratricopeptide (TPR) repeat protein